MIKAEKLSYSFPEKELYKDISFTIEENQHCAFIGTNGTGKSTLVDMIMDQEEYMYTGKLKVKKGARIGYVSQFAKVEEGTGTVGVFDYLSEHFVKLNQSMTDVCSAMETATELDELMEQYQRILDDSLAVDADNYEVNIFKELKIAGLENKDKLPIEQLSGGEFKLVQVIREMMQKPDIMIMDEPDVFLDFDNLNALRGLINTYQGTLLVITHNRYLLNNCFDKILHLEDADIQEFDGTYTEYRFSLLEKKLEMQEQSVAEQEEIDRNRALVERYRAQASKIANPAKGRALHARVSMLERLEARHIKPPFVDIAEPNIVLRTPEVISDDRDEGAVDGAELDIHNTVVDRHTDIPDANAVLSVEDYSVHFDEMLVEHASFEIGRHDKVAIVGANGTGKTTMLREIWENSNPTIRIAEDVKVDYLSQTQGEVLNEAHTIEEEFGVESVTERSELLAYLTDYGFTEESLSQRVSQLSGGERNMLQLAMIARREADLLLLDEPTSHLDLYSQEALEKAIAAYDGAILMVSHDFYTVANCMDYILLVEDKTIRRVSIRKFRKMIYADYFKKDYLELEQQKKELELKIERSMKNHDFDGAADMMVDLETVINKMN